MAEIENKSEEEKINTSNIFDEFEVDDDTREEIDNLTKVKDSYYYMELVWNILKYINFVLIFIIIIWYFYYYIETTSSDFAKNKDYLNPICFVLNWVEEWKIWNNCSWINNSLAILEKNSEEKEIQYLKKVIPILSDSYEVESIKNSKEVLFLFDKKENKNDPIEILNEFDKLKNKFIPIKKSKIVCNDILIEENKLTAKCSSFSTSWYKDIPWIDIDKKIWGTSITLASSFINFLWNSDNFDIIDKQKIFDKKPYFWEWEYTYKTDFKISLEYNNNDLILN